MALFRCKMCGGNLEITNETVATCEFCGTQQTLPRANAEMIQNLFNRANTLRLKCEFDKAEQIYEKILQENDAEPEAHWGIVLCKYGIEYVEDPKTYKRIPTCHRTSYDAVLTDADYLAAIRNADDAQKAVYEAEAKAIDEIQKNILSIVKEEKPFDVFLCYKETDAQGKRTADSVIANDIYHQLTQEGLKVFYAAITLEDKLGREYEPYIFAALNSAKVMLVVGSKPEYFTAVWVKNEWSRFLKLMKTDRSKLLIPCYKDMDAYELPEEFSHLQAQDMSKIGFINDVVRGIKKVTQPQEAKPAAPVAEPVATAAPSLEPLLERVFMFLEDGDWDSANEYCEKVLDMDPRNPRAYLGKLMAEVRAQTPERLKHCPNPYDDSNNYQKVLRFGDAELKATLEGYVEHIKERNEINRLEGIYNRGKDLMSKATTEKEYIDAAQRFEYIASYRDSADMAKHCRQKAEEAKEAARKDQILAAGVSRMNKKPETMSNLEEAMAILKQIPGWKTADELYTRCESRLNEIQEKLQRERQEREEKAERERREREHQAELARKEAEIRKKKNRNFALIMFSVLVVLIGVIVLFTMVILPQQEGADFIAQYGQEVFDRYGVVEQGKYITFGRYEQDNDWSNGKEAIEWKVLEVQDGRALLLSRYALTRKPYEKSFRDVNWETCTLRNWLNTEFKNDAFTPEEQAWMLPTGYVSGPENTADLVFLLNQAEWDRLSNYIPACNLTAYGATQGEGYEMRSIDWWLRSSSQDGRAPYVWTYSGRSHSSSTNANAKDVGVRPAIWIDLNP